MNQQLSLFDSVKEYPEEFEKLYQEIINNLKIKGNYHRNFWFDSPDEAKHFNAVVQSVKIQYPALNDNSGETPDCIMPYHIGLWEEGRI